MTKPAGATAVDEQADALPGTSRVVGRVGLALFAVLAYVPLLVTDVGKVDADSKAYLYLDPGRFLAGTPSLWDPKIGMGTVAYQMLGFLFPVAPFYWVTEHLLGLPPWIAERLWLGTLIFAAGLGARYLLRTLGLRGPGIAVGMVAYAFTPYAIQFSSHTSVLLGPWAGMPWMTAFVILSLRRGGWKYPALLAITVQLTGSVNASTLIFALLAPAIWIPYAVLLTREVDWRRAFATIWRSTVLIVLTSLWWAWALVVESGYGRDVLRFTEQPVTTSATLYPVEILRGLGYWIFYYRDGNGPVQGAAATFMRNPTVLIVSILIPALALLAATGVRWTYRAYFVLLVLVGVTLGVGSSASGGSSPFSSAFRSFSSNSTAGFALRNSGRAVPLVVLGLACLLAAGVTAIHKRLAGRGHARAGLLFVAVVLVLLLVDAPGVWGRSYYDPAIEYKAVPTYWKQAASSLDAKSHDTRVLALPGSPFATYTWGSTQDPVEPGLMTRPFVTVEQIPWGSDATANLLSAVDVPLQAGQLDPAALAPVARLMGAGDVLLDMDLKTHTYGLIPAESLWSQYSTPPAGLAAPETFGKDPVPTSGEVGNVARPPLVSPNPLAVLPVEQPLNIVRTKSDADPVVVDGDGDGLVSMASVGLLDARRLVLYSPTFEHQPSVLRDLPSSAALVVTDSNRKRPYWATSLTKSYGPTEQANEDQLTKSDYDQRLEVFPGSSTNSQTVTILHGVKSVKATQGYHVFNLTSTRPSLVVDGSVYTGWSVDAGALRVGHERLRLELVKPITTDQINIVQPVDDGTQGRWVTGVTLRFDGKNAVHRELGYASRTQYGETLHFPKQKFSTVEVQIDNVHHTKGALYDAVGFQEIRVADDTPYAKPVTMQEVTRMPLDLLKSLGKDSLEHPLTFVVSRDAMDDSGMSRQIWLPTARSFTLSGTARPGARAFDADLDHFLGIPGEAEGAVTASSVERYNDPTARASSAIDGDLSTAWTTPLGTGTGVMQVTVPQSVTFDHLDLELVDDNRHSLPTGLQIQSDNGAIEKIDLARLPHTLGPDGIVSVPVTFDPISGHTLTFSISTFKPRITKTIDHPEGTFLPSGIAELGIPGVQRAAMPANLPNRCSNDLLTVDGKPFPVRITGTTADALKSPAQSLTVQPCNGKTLTLSAGVHEIHAAESPNSPSGADIQHVVLASGPGGEAIKATTAHDAPTNAHAPAVRVTHESRTSMTLDVDAASKPYWLVLGQSLNRGWVATADGHDLGEPTLVDGYANGWLVKPGASGKSVKVTLEWAPQKGLRLALLISFLAMAACIGIVAGAFARRRRLSIKFANAAPPTLRRILWPRPLDRRRGAIIGTVVAITALGSLLVDLWVGPVVGVFVVLAILYPRARLALRVAPAALVVGSAIYVVWVQMARSYAPVFEWPSYFNAVRTPVWIALVLVAADALISVVWRTDFDEGASG